MMNFKTVVQQFDKHTLNMPIAINNNLVWDYKQVDTNTVALIAQDPFIDIKEDFVTLTELKKFITSLNIPYDLVVFVTEADREVLSKVSKEENCVNFSHT